MELSNREIASAILLGSVLLLFVLLPRLRPTFLKSLADVAKAFFVLRLGLVLTSYLVYTALIVFTSYRLGLWSTSLTKDTIIVVFFVGLPFLFGAYKIKKGSKLVSSVVKETIGVSALLFFYLELVPLPLVGELISQVFVTFCVLMSTVANMKPETKKIGSCFQVLTVISFLGIFIYATVQFVKKRHNYDWDSVIASFGLSVWLPLMLVPFVYVFAFLVHSESILVTLPRFNEGKKPKLRIRLGLLLGLHFSAGYAALFVGMWRKEISRSKTFRCSLEVMRKFRAEVRRRAQAEKSRIRLLKRNTGVKGTDAQGLALDRREFFETKETLGNLFIYQTASMNDNGEYRANFLETFGHLVTKLLSTEHEFNFVLSEDRRSWYVWRVTPGGWVFGIGEVRSKDEKWTYFSAESPTSFPKEDHRGWFSDLGDTSCDEWLKDDRPIRSS